MAQKLMVLTNEVKKVGVIIDRGQRMEFRPGDELIIYVSMGGFEKWRILVYLFIKTYKDDDVS